MPESPEAELPKRIIPEAELEEAALGLADAGDPAVRETFQLTSGKSQKELQDDAMRKEHVRDQRFRDHFENLAILSMYIMFGTLCLFGAVWAFQMILPEGCVIPCFWHTCCIRRWLTSDQVTILQDIVTGGVIGGVLADHFRKRMSR